MLRSKQFVLGCASDVAGDPIEAPLKNGGAIGSLAESRNHAQFDSIRPSAQQNAVKGSDDCRRVKPGLDDKIDHTIKRTCRQNGIGKHRLDVGKSLSAQAKALTVTLKTVVFLRTQRLYEQAV